MLPEVIIHRKERSREISINDIPMMLLPKARVRDYPGYYENNRARSCTVVADNSASGLHISTIQSVNAVDLRTSSPVKSALKTRRNSIAKSDADSGISSLKRAVTFENLSQSRSTVYKSDDESDIVSDSSNDDDFDYETLKRQTLSPTNELPDHLDTFGIDEPVLLNPPAVPKTPKSAERTSGRKRRNHGHEDPNEAEACNICGMVLSDEERVKKSFGKVDHFLDWVMSKWGKRRELQYIPRPSYVYRGHAPHFCNFVQQVPLHSKQASATDSTGLPDSELDDDIEFITETAEGRMINKWRKNSGTSNATDIQNWLSNKKIGKGLFLRYFSSIPETKEDGLNSGTEGRPGSPSSLDGTEVRLDDDPSSRPVTGIEVRVSSPVKSETGSMKKVVPVSDEIKETTKDMIGCVGRNSTIPEEDIVPPDQPAKAWDDGKSQKSADSLLILNNVDNNNINGNGRPQSPRQPPPSPEPTLRATKTPEPPPSTGRKRSCVNKKTKKPIERVRKMKEPEPAPKEPDPPAGEETAGVAPPVVESDKVDAKVDLKVPDLPSTNEDKKSKKKEKSKPKKHLIEAEDDLFKADPTDVLNDQMKQNRTEVDWSNMDTNGMDDVKRPPQIKSWIQGRLALSQQSSRFELPMDMKLLESMTPQEYIRKYCIITSRRQNLYSKIFLKNKDKSQVILFKDLDKTLKDVLVHTITSEQVQDILKTFEIDENTKVDYKLFAGISAFAERVLYPKYVTEDTVYMPEYQKEKIECADFCALDWKFHGVKVNPTMQNLLMQLR